VAGTGTVACSIIGKEEASMQDFFEGSIRNGEVEVYQEVMSAIFIILPVFKDAMAAAITV
jgi:hypothetical protein